jgi:hypothetical protein
MGIVAIPLGVELDYHPRLKWTCAGPRNEDQRFLGKQKARNCRFISQKLKLVNLCNEYSTLENPLKNYNFN